MISTNFNLLNGFLSDDGICDKVKVWDGLYQFNHYTSQAITLNGYDPKKLKDLAKEFEEVVENAEKEEQKRYVLNCFSNCYLKKLK